MNFSFSNVWMELGATLSGVGIAATAVAPLIINSSMPTTAAGWLTEAVAISTALLKVFGNK